MTDHAKRDGALPRSRILLAMLLVLVWACTKDGGAPQAEAPADGSEGVTLSTWPSPPVALETTNFLLRLPAATVAAGRKPRVVIDLSMPGMYHGENRPPCIEADRGEYLCKGYLVMGGRWEVAVEIDGREAARFPIDAVEKP